MSACKSFDDCNVSSILYLDAKYEGCRVLDARNERKIPLKTHLHPGVCIFSCKSTHLLRSAIVHNILLLLFDAVISSATEMRGGYAFVTNGDGCFCGRRLTPTNYKLDHSDCDSPCAQSPNLTCGGDGGADVYDVSTYTGPNCECQFLMCIRVS